MAEKQEAVKVKKKPGKFRRTMGWAFKPMVNVKGWMGYDQVKSGYTVLSDTINQLFTVTEAEHTESFEEAKIRLNLTDAQIARQIESFSRMVLVFKIITGVLLAFALYLLFTGGYFGAGLTFLLAIISAANIFRYHFWLFQLKQKKLGCSVQEWFHATCLGRSK